MKISKPEDLYDPLWVLWNEQNPGVIKSLSAAAADDDDPGDDNDGDDDDNNDDDDDDDGLLSDALKDKKDGDDDDDDDDGDDDDDDGDEERPAHVPKAFWDAKNGQVRVEKMAKALADTQAALRKGGSKNKEDPAPESADSYFKDYELPEDLKGKIEIPEDDPLLKSLGSWAHKAGIGPKAIDELLSGDDGILKIITENMPEPYDKSAELEKLGSKGKEQLAAVATWVKGLEADGVITANDANVLKPFASRAEGVKVLAKIRGSMMGGGDIPFLHDDAQDGKLTMAQYEARHADDRYVNDPEFREETERLGKHLFKG